MEEDESKRLRYSVWPDQVLEIPPVIIWPAKLRDGLVLYRTWDRNPKKKQGFARLVAVPDELYLRELMALDPMDDQSLLSFVSSWGPFGSTVWPAHDLAPWLEPDLKQGLMDQSLMDPPEDIAPDKDWGDFHLNFVVQTVQSVRTHALCLRDAVRLWQLQTHQISMDELTETWEMKAIDEQPPADPDEALTVLADILNAGLRPFHAGLRVIAPNKDEVVGRHDITNVYSVMCLQLFNHIVENAVYMRCHNETCGRLFVRQRGRAKQGKYHTTGVMYCSDYCARAQGQREIRRRKVVGRKIGEVDGRESS